MKSVQFGDLTVRVTVDRPDHCCLPAFIDQITHDAPTGEASHRFHLTTGPAAQLTVDVTDHARKLVDPGLDHVSVFDTPAQVRVCRPPHQAGGGSNAHAVLDALVGLPVVRVGISALTDLPTSVRAAHQILGEVLA